MGRQGTEARIRGTLVLDAGGLIAFERGDRRMAALIKRGSVRASETVIPSTALAEVWRGGPRSARLAQLLDSATVDDLDEERAKEVGARLGARGAADVADAHLVCCAHERRATVATSDEAGIRALEDPDEPLALIVV